MSMVMMLPPGAPAGALEGPAQDPNGPALALSAAGTALVGGDGVPLAEFARALGEQMAATLVSAGLPGPEAQPGLPLAGKELPPGKAGDAQAAVLADGQLLALLQGTQPEAGAAGAIGMSVAALPAPAPDVLDEILAERALARPGREAPLAVTREAAAGAAQQGVARLVLSTAGMATGAAADELVPLPDMEAVTAARLPEVQLASRALAPLAEPASAVAAAGAPLPAPTTSTGGALSVPLRIDVPPGDPGWSETLGNRVSWLIQNQHPAAQLRLNPPHLGPLEVRVAVQNEQASVTFTVHHAVTADHLEAALPRLREMLADSGLNLAQFDIRQQASGDGSARGPGGEAASGESEALADADGEPTAGIGTARSAEGLLDIYA